MNNKSKNKKGITVNKDKVRMSWTSYNFLKNLVEDCQKKLENEWQKACFFIPEEPYRSGRKTSRDKAYEVFTREWAALEAIRKELRDSIAEGYKDHPNKEMREFWGV